MPSAPIPRIGEKNGSKRRLLVDARGIPLSLVVSGAETPEVSLLAETLTARVLRMKPSIWPEDLSGDNGDTGAAAWHAAADAAIAHVAELEHRTVTSKTAPSTQRALW